MRSALLGVVLGDRPEALKEFTLRSTRLTHSDPKAFLGALAVALAAYLSSQPRNPLPEGFAELIGRLLPGEEGVELIRLLDGASVSASKGEAVGVFAESIGSRHGISGYMYHTVPCVIQTWLRYPGDYAGGMREILSAGGDTDTAGAILGGIIGARVGKEGIPAEWTSGVMEWPRSIRWMEQLGGCLAQVIQDDREIEPPRAGPLFILLRNLFFLVVVLLHGLRRLAPPY
jgi:ADP-ribosylglycohydrolase